MIDNDLNKRFFTSADSPVPLIPDDMAWDNMHKKLDDTEKKKRRLIIWIPPFTIVFIAVLITGAVVFLLNTKRENPKGPYTKASKATNDTIAYNRSKQNTITKIETRKTVPDKKDADSVNKTVNEQSVTQPAHRTTNSLLTIINTGKTKRKKEKYRNVPALTVQDENGNIAHQKKRPSRRVLPKEKESIYAGNIVNSSDDEKKLPFSFPKLTPLTDTILVKANRPLAVPLQAEKEDSMHKAVWVEAGLQWNAPVPTQGNEHYWKGANGNNQVTTLLIPGIWFSVNKGKQRLLASVNPFVSAPLHDKYYGWGMVPATDTTDLLGQKKMIKMFGYQASLQYGYRFGNNFLLGGGFDATWWKKGLVYARAADSNLTFKPFIYSVAAKDEDAIKQFQLSASVSLSCQLKACEAILQVSAPFGGALKNVHTPLWIRFGVRWRLVKRSIHPSSPMAHPLPQ